MNAMAVSHRHARAAPALGPFPRGRSSAVHRSFRAAFFALGIAIGVAAIVAVLAVGVLGVGLLAEINALGTNLLNGDQRPDPLRPDCRAARRRHRR